MSLLIFLVNLFLKSLYITSIPPILTNDEVYYATEAQAIIANGTDVTGQWHPWDLAPANPIYSELTGVLSVPGHVLFPESTQLAAKVTPVLMGSCLPILLGLIMYKLWARKVGFLTTAVMSTFNPWIFQFSRMSFDSLPSVFFYSLGIVVLLYAKGWKLLIALAPLGLGFFQYQGHKPLLVPFTMITLTYIVWSELRENMPNGWRFSSSKAKLMLLKLNVLPAILVILATCCLVGWYLLRLPHLTSGVRVSEFSVSAEKLGEIASTQRRLSFENKLLPIFQNKGLVFMDQISQRLLGSFDLQWLFQHGNDQVDTFAVTKFGFLYGIDGLLAVMSLWLLITYKKMRPGIIFLLALLAASVLPNIIKNDNIWLTFRGSFTVIVLLLLSAMTSSVIWLQSGSRTLKYALLGVYCLSVAPFLFHYFYSYPILTTKDIFFYNRVLASYIQRQPNESFVVFSNNPKTLFDSLLAYNHIINQKNFPKVQAAFAEKKYQIGNFTIKDTCYDQLWVATQSGKIILKDFGVVDCETTTKLTTAQAQSAQSNTQISISSLIDSGEIYSVTNDRYCSLQPLPAYTHIKKNVFEIEKLAQSDFCTSFFTSHQ